MVGHVIPGYPGEMGLVAGPLGPLGFDFTQHRHTLRPTVDGTRSKALRPFGFYGVLTGLRG